MVRWMGNLSVAKRAYCQETGKLNPIAKYNLARRTFKSNPFRYLIYVSVLTQNF